MIWNEGAGGKGRNDLAPVCKWMGAPQYQRLNYWDPGCPAEFEITTEEECRRAITSTGAKDFNALTFSKTTMPRGCSVQKNSNTMIFNEGTGGSGRNDLAPVCKWTGTPTPDPAPAPVPDDRDNVTVSRQKSGTTFWPS